MSRLFHHRQFLRKQPVAVTASTTSTAKTGKERGEEDLGSGSTTAVTVTHHNLPGLCKTNCCSPGDTEELPFQGAQGGNHRALCS